MSVLVLISIGMNLTCSESKTATTIYKLVGTTCTAVVVAKVAAVETVCAKDLDNCLSM